MRVLNARRLTALACTRGRRRRTVRPRRGATTVLGFPYPVPESSRITLALPPA
jgi:hypothetical protein